MKPMMRTRRSTVALAATALVLALAACGSEEAPEVVEGSSAAEGSSAEAAAAETGATGGSVEQDAADETDGGETDGGGTDGGETDGGEVGGDVEAARAGLARYFEANKPETPTTSTDIPGCPVLEVSVLEERMAEAGLADTTLEGWATEIEWNEYEDISPDLMGVACGGDSDGNPHDSDFGTAGGMVAVDLSGHTDFATFLGDLGLSADGDVSGDTVTICPETGFCTSLWHSDGLVIGVTLMADGVDEETAGALLEASLPDALTTLANN